MTRYGLLKDLPLNELLKKGIISKKTKQKVEVYELYLIMKKKHTRSNYLAVFFTSKESNLSISAIYKIVKFMEN